MQRPVRKKIILAVCLMPFMLFPLAAADGGLSVEIPSVTQSFDSTSSDLFASPFPITYGEETFRQRILERTQGTRDPIGLVLSGGSARAMAHVGVLKYMEEAGIVPDFIISNSMGSIVALLYSAGFSPDQIAAILTETDLDALFDLVLPLKGGLLSLSRFESLLAAYIGRVERVEESAIPVMIVVEDLVTKRQVHIMEGDYATVLAASFAIPVYFDPVEYQGHMVIDGGITNLTPLSLAYDFTDTVIVSTTFYDVDTLNLRNPLTVLNVSLDIGKRREGAGELYRYADSVLWIRPDVEQISYMEFSKAEEIIQKGYEAAEARREDLAVLAETSRDPSTLDDIRAARDRDIRRVRAQKLPFGHTPAARTSGTVTLGLESHGYPGSTQYLREDTGIGLEYLLRTGNLVFSALGGGGARLQSNADMRMHPLVSLRAEYYPLSFLRFSLDMAGFLANGSPLISDFYLSAGAEARHIFSGSKLSLSAVGTAEVAFQADRQSPEREALLSAGLRGSYFLPGTLMRRPLQLSLLYQAYGQGSTLEMRSFGAAGLSASYQIGRVLTLDGVASTRFAFDGQGGVPYFSQDGYRSRLTDILRHGRTASTTSASSPFMMAASVYLGLAPFAVNPSMGELILFEQPRLGPYVDLLWNDGWLPRLAVGGQFDVTLKIIGLKEIPIILYGGYEFARDQGEQGGLVWGLTFKM